MPQGHAMDLAEAFSAARPRQGLITRSQLDELEVPQRAFRRALREGHVLRVRRAVYAAKPQPARAKHLVSGGRPDPGYLAEVRAALLSLGEGVAAGGRTAAVLWGFDMVVEPHAVVLAVPRGRSWIDVKGVVAGEHRSLDVEEVPVLGFEPVRMLSAVATVLDCALTRPTVEAVAIADSAIRVGAVTFEALQHAFRAWSGKPGASRVRRVLALLDPATGSVLESMLRVHLAQNGMRPESQVSLLDRRGKLIGRVDFLFREQRLVVECDGRRRHDPEDARERDRVRDNELERAGWRLLRVTWSDVMHHPDSVISLVRDCLELQPLAA